ncbi:MAG: hypothetical protein MJE68_15320, partial [Proteobacteria bacterium]|nr:hypothetical protein [Pseudomonadota bacterium]
SNKIYNVVLCRTVSNKKNNFLQDSVQQNYNSLQDNVQQNLIFAGQRPTKLILCRTAFDKIILCRNSIQQKK